MNSELAGAIASVRAASLDREYALVEGAIPPGGRTPQLIDVGCSSLGLLGRNGNRLEYVRAKAIGVDIDRDSLKVNPNVHHRVGGDCYALPFQSGTVDIIVCRWVFEHLEFPEKALTEFRRVLKPGGVLYIKTPNLLNYAMLIAWLTPTWFHNLFRSSTGMGENIPTFYRANTKKRLAALASEHGFAVRALECYPYSFMYYSFSGPLFWMMKAVSSAVGRFSDRVQLMLLCVIVKV